MAELELGPAHPGSGESCFPAAQSPRGSHETEDYQHGKCYVAALSVLRNGWSGGVANPMSLRSQKDAVVSNEACVLLEEAILVV